MDATARTPTKKFHEKFFRRSPLAPLLAPAPTARLATNRESRPSQNIPKTSQPTQINNMHSLWSQRLISLAARRRGCHLVTEEIVRALPELEQLRVGLLHLFLQHTSASLLINENADPDVPRDLEMALNSIASEDLPYVHTLEGPDDMPAHVKNALLGCSLSLPVHDGRLAFGAWQGIYLCEHRNRAGARRVVATMHGERRG